MAPPDDETPTPRVSASYQVFRAEAERLADEMDRAALLFAKRLDHVDRNAERRAAGFALQLRAMAARFEQWPTMPAEVVARERAVQVQVFLDVADEAIALLEAMPSHPALGRVRRYR